MLAWLINSDVGGGSDDHDGDDIDDNHNDDYDADCCHDAEDDDYIKKRLF